MSQPKPPSAQTTAPDDFLWGAATAAHQVEGGQHNDWSPAWESAVAEALANGSKARLQAKRVPNNAAIYALAADPENYISGTAADHYHRYRQDFDILQELGCNSYRFSVEWARVEPQPGVYDQKELDHYHGMVRELRRRGITPLVTLHHFSNPDWLEARGGWHGREVVERFTKYAAAVAKTFGSSVTYYCTINEPGSYLFMRYAGGNAWPLWPNATSNPLQAYAYMRNVVKAQRAARRAIKASNPEAQVGLAHALVNFRPRDPLGWLMKRVLTYIPDGYWLARLKRDADYIGVQYYITLTVAARLRHPMYWTSYWDGTAARSDTGWGICPGGLYAVTQQLKRYKLPQLITENGIADAADTRRAGFIRDHIAAMDRSRADGADIRGYFYWSLLDNYEWSEGFWPQFGLVAVDRKTQQRTVRASAREYAQIIKQHTRK